MKKIFLLLLALLFSAAVASAEEDYDYDIYITLETEYVGMEETAVITAVDEFDDVLWMYECGQYPAAQLSAFAEIGMWEEMYYFCENGSIVALDAYTGEGIWANDDFSGSPAMDAFVFDDDGNLYISGYLGPDLFAVSKYGETLFRIDTFAQDIYWPYRLEYLGDHSLEIYFEMGPDYSEEGFVRYVDLTEYIYMEHDDYYDEVPEPSDSGGTLIGTIDPVITIGPEASGSGIDEYMDEYFGVYEGDFEEWTDGFYEDGTVVYSDEYILPESADMYLSELDISSLTLKGLCYAKNELYARYGRKFSSDELQEYFDGQSWYEGKYEPNASNDTKIVHKMNKYEKYNLDVLSKAENKLGPYSLD